MGEVTAEWLDAKERKQRIRLLTKTAQAVVKRVRTGSYDEEDTERLKALDEEKKRLEAIEQGETDVAYFAYRYFSDEYNPDNKAGNIIRNSENGELHETMDEIAPIHRDFYRICDEVTTKRNGNYVIASPRGHSKTSIMSTILTLHELVYRKRYYVLILSETDSLSKKIVASISSQLKYNEKLRQDFGELLHVQPLKNQRDNEDSFILSTGALVEASSAGKSLRGKQHNSRRPDLLCLDDLSSLNNENTEAARVKLIDWFNTVLTPLPAKDAAIVFVGTKVTATGLLAHLLDRRDYKNVFHSAIISPPTNPQLWQDYLQLYQTEPDMRKVDEFYEAHEADMLDGVELAWPKRWSYRELMHVKSNIGARAFASEYMNESFAEDEQLFDVDHYEYCRKVFDGQANASIEYNGKYYPIRELEITGAWDVALAATSRSALNAFITIGRDSKSGLIFVIDSYASREVPSEFMDRIIERIHEYHHSKVIVEGIGAYSEFYRQLLERTRIERLYSTRIELLKSHGKASKSSRIESLEPMLANKTLILNQAHDVMLTELRHYPHGLVDVIDALQIAVASGSKPKSRIMPKPAWM